MLYMEHSAPLVPQTDGLRLQLQGMTLCEGGIETRLKDISKRFEKTMKEIGGERKVYRTDCGYSFMSILIYKLICLNTLNT